MFWSFQEGFMPALVLFHVPHHIGQPERAGRESTAPHLFHLVDSLTCLLQTRRESTMKVETRCTFRRALRIRAASYSSPLAGLVQSTTSSLSRSSRGNHTA